MRRVVIGLAVAALATTACSGQTAATIGTRQADPRAQAGGVLRVGIVRPASIDPQLVATADTAGALVVRTMCDSLLGADPESRELEPAVAESYRLLGPATFQLKIRRGLRFSDGSKVTAQDAIAALRRVIDPDVVSPQAPLLTSLLGFSAVQDGKIDADAVYGLRANGADSVQVLLNRDDTQFISTMALPLAVPVPRALASRPGFSSHPVCVGPYRLVGKYTGTEPTITLERNPNYPGLRSSLSRSGRGWADRVVFRIYATRTAALAGLRKGEVDTAQIGSADVAAARADRLTIASATTGRLEYVGLPNREPFANPIVAAALSRALNRTLINSRAFHGTRTPALNLIPPTLPDSVLPRADVRDCGMTASGSLTDARRLLQGAGVTSGMLRKAPLRFYFNDEFDNRALVNQVARTWAQLGVVATPQPQTFDQLIARGAGTGGFDGLFRMTATAEWADQGAFVIPLISTSALGKTNLTGFNGTLLQRAIERKLMKAVPVGDQKSASLTVATQTCATPVIPIAWYQVHLAVSPAVVLAANHAVDRAVGLPELRELAVG